MLSKLAVATVNYRLSSEEVFPAQVHDVKGAIRFLRLHAGEWGLDPDKIALWGSSAGAHLAALAGTSTGEESLEGPLNPGPSSRVRAVVDWFGPTDFLLNDPQLIAQGCQPDPSALADVDGSNIARLLGATPSRRPDLAAWANPLSYVSADDPPFLIQHGTEDCGVPMGQSVILRDALLGAGVADVTLDQIMGAGHGISDPGFNNTINVQRVTDWILARLLK